MIIFMLMNRLNRVFLHQKPHIFSYRNLYFNSSQGSGEQKASKSKLTPLQQKALVGYYAMLRIATFSQQNFLQSSYSLREYLINKDHFFNFVSKKSKADLRGVIDDECLDEVLDGFRIGKGAKYARYVFSQERFAKAQSPRKDDKKFQLNSSQSSNSISLEHKSQQQEDIKVFPQEREESAFQAHQQIDQEEQDKDEIPKKQVKQQEYSQSKSPFGNIVLNPLSYTGKIIDQILFCNTLIVCGQKGAGKSFAYLIYTYCTDFIFQLRRSQQYQQKNQEEMFKYVNKSLFENVPRLSYFPLKKKNTFSQIAKVLQYQNQHVKPILLPEKQKLELYYSQQKIKRQIFERYLEEITTLDENKNIISGCIIDQANHYYQQIRTYLKNSQNYRGMTILETERVLMKQNAFLKSKWISEVIQSVYSYFTPTILNSSQNIQKKYLEQVNENYQLNFFDILSHETELVYPINYKKYLQTQAGQVELYGVFWFQIETKLNYHNQSEETIKKLRKIFNNTFSLPGSNSSKKNSLSFWKKDVRFYNIRKVIRNLSLTQLKKYFEQNTIKMLRKRIENNRQQTFGKHFSKFFNKGLEKDNILRHRFLSLLNLYVGRLLKNRPTQIQQKTEFIIENPHQFGQEFFIELRQSLDLQAYSIKGVDGKESVKCIFHYTPQFVRDLTEKNMEVLIKKYKSFIVQLAGNMDIDSSCVGQIYQGLLNFFVYPAEVALKMVQYDRGGRNSELTFDIVDTQPILSQTKSNKQKQIKKPSIQQSLQPVLISAEKHPQCYVAGIPTNRSHFFFDFAIAKYSSKDASTKKLQLWLIDYTVGELSKKAAQKYKVLSQFIGKFDTFCPGYDVKVNFYLASPNELSEEYANFMRVKSKQGQKNNLFTILGQFKDKKEALQKKFQFKIMGVPKLVQFLNFKQQYIYPVNKNTAFEYIAQAQLFFDTFVKLSTKKAVKK